MVILYILRYIPIAKIATARYHNMGISNSEFLVSYPVQAELLSKKNQKAKHLFEYFWLGITLRPEGSRNLF